jgi:glycosyltransferase involved in cell wall biosynthesis
MPNRVLFIAPAIKPGGGAPGYMHNLIAGVRDLSSSGALRNQFDFLGDISIERNRATGENIARNDFRLTIIRFLTKIGLKKILSKKVWRGRSKINCADLVVIQGFQEAYFAKYARNANKRLAYMPHSPSIMADEYKMLCELNGNYFDKEKYNRLFQEESTLIKLADFMVFPSIGASESYRNKFHFELSGCDIVYIKSGVKMDHIEASQNKVEAMPSTVRVMFAGRYVSHKGFDLFCEAASLVSTTHDLEFVSVGAGPMKSKNILVTDLGWQNDVLNFLKTADIVVIPNRIAYYDLLPLECAALGKPLVMTAVGGNVDQMRDLPDTISCEDVTPSKLAQSIESAILQIKANKKWGMNNANAYESIFSAENFARRWDDVVSDLMGAK